VQVVPVRVRGRYDAAETTADNRRHWAKADALSAGAANSPEVRRTLRNRARYEVANNSYAKGIVLTLANDVIGTGPRLQLLTDDPEADRRVEADFARWAQAVGLPEKLRTMPRPSARAYMSLFCAPYGKSEKSYPPAGEELAALPRPFSDTFARANVCATCKGGGAVRVR
jgi:hypothetical protein